MYRKQKEKLQNCLQKIILTENNLVQ